MSWISRAYGCRLCMDLPEANSTTVRDLYCLWAACPCLSWSAVAMRALTWVVFVPRASFTPTLRSGSSPSPTWQRAGHIACTSLHEIFKCAHLKFTVYGRKQTDIHTHNFCKCSHASVGLTQDCSNYIFMTCTCMWPVHVYSPTAWNGLIRCPHFHYACVNTCTKST